MLSKKTVNEQAIKKLCQDVLFPQAELALRLRAVLLQGIVIVYSRQTIYLAKDCKDTLKSFQEALHKPHTTQINLPDSTSAPKDLVRRPMAETDFFVDASDVLLLGGPSEAVRGDGSAEVGKLELDQEVVLGDHFSQLSIRREDITLRQDEGLSGVMIGASGGELAAGGDEVLLGAGFDFQFDGNVEFDQQEQHMELEAPPLDAALAERNELLDMMNLEDDHATPGVKATRKRVRSMARPDNKTRIEASTLRDWLKEDRTSAIDRPQLAPVILPGVSSNPRSLNMSGVCSELEALTDVPEMDGDESFSSDHLKRSRASSVEQGRANDDDDGAVVAMDMGWDDALMADQQQREDQVF